MVWVFFFTHPLQAAEPGRSGVGLLENTAAFLSLSWFFLTFLLARKRSAGPHLARRAPLPFGQRSPPASTGAGLSPLAPRPGRGQATQPRCQPRGSRSVLLPRRAPAPGNGHAAGASSAAPLGSLEPRALWGCLDIIRTHWVHVAATRTRM